MGMIYDEFAMKRLGGLRRLMQKKKHRLSPDGLKPLEELQLCRTELTRQRGILAALVQHQLQKPPVITDSGIQAASPHLKIPVSESIPNRSVRNKFGAPRCTLATGHGSRLGIEAGGRYSQSAEPPSRSVNSLLRVLNERGFDPREYNGLARLHVRPL